MANSGNEPNETFWDQDHGNQQQQQFATADCSVPAPSSSYYHPTADSGLNYNHLPAGDNFTVLADGFGNFIKVYHQPSEDVNLNNPTGKYEYELFSSNNNFMRPAPGLGYFFHQQQPQQQQGPAPVTTTSSAVGQPENAVSNTSMLINQLVGNWAPTISGTYSPFGGGGPSLLAEGLPRSSPETFVQAQQPPFPPQHQPQTSSIPQQVQPSPVHQPAQMHQQLSPKALNDIVNPTQQQPVSAVAAAATTTINYNQLNDDNSAKLNQNVNKKQRIVAEVKPMRMSYSDVLSKNVVPSTTPMVSTSANGTTGSGTNAKQVASFPGNNGHSSAGGKSNKAEKSVGKKPQSFTNSEEKFNRKMDRNNATGQKKVGVQSGGSVGLQQSTETPGCSKSTLVTNGSDKLGRKIDKPNNKNLKGGNISAGKKNRLRNFNDSYTIQDVQSVPNKETHTSGEAEELDEDNEDQEEEDDDDSEEYDEESHQQQQQQSFMYNVKKNNNPNDTHIEKIAGSRGAHKRSGRTSGTGRMKPEKSHQQSPNGKRGQRPRKNQKSVIIQKIVNAWLEYSVIVLLWLWSLVSDVVYLSLRLVWDYLVAGYQYCEQHVTSLKQELQQNRPGSWLKSVWKSFDNRFAKDSGWAFWRGKPKSAPTEDQTTPGGKNYYKDGRLPSTADEAMSSLLNCKGKDAYSILGVSPECSQEQIRKHYKKIAVLVHPDKNKQPGAEEAFKVLQRSFELIGEPENRKGYDQSLAEALNAEKAWSEINDLLTQLHTKISEAANTIRCSSCCLRHPRKPTGRAHYAARECNSCKIRHSAREGDIWAETSFFGMRWKYLAMMEGNVYDITEWANCQKGALSHLQPNSHIVQYRIVLGGNSQQQQQQQQQHGQQQSGAQGQPSEKDAAGRSRKDAPSSEPNLDDFLNNIYGGQNQQGQQQAQSSSRRRHRRN
ncbi:uncharacterized protein LOC131676979 [Topomyia yanbarensis]|uniref:uncharacterized protein LOC131676979 n=1 Tax=Topomyia yanbarensis TaxID=2498891 RepID=UPI00273C6A91|nr:uncharacterized protein LOC131676979 [Topomyia yanbarensis]XP_058812425.1 uncharacterized protein LOC131676979 [Topomyia yanbarensis]